MNDNIKDIEKLFQESIDQELIYSSDILYAITRKFFALTKELHGPHRALSFAMFSLFNFNAIKIDASDAIEYEEAKALFFSIYPCYQSAIDILSREGGEVDISLFIKIANSYVGENRVLS